MRLDASGRPTHPARILPALAVGLLALAGTRTATAQHSDIEVGVADATIVTGFLVDGDVVEQRAFASTMGDSGFPGFTANPGFNALSGTFDPSGQLGFDLRSELTVWTGGSLISTGPGGTLGERLRVSRFGLEVISDAGFVPGFTIAIAPNGSIHQHVNFTLLPEDGESAPQPGVYVMEFHLFVTEGDIVTSLPFWIAYDHEAPDGELEAAVAWIEMNLIDTAECPSDLDDSGDVGFGDLLLLLAAWGDCPDGAACPSDVDASGAVDFNDLLTVLSAWGPCV